MLNKYAANDAYAKLNTLLVDLLNYGAASQIFEKHKTDDLANSELTNVQKAWGTSDVGTLTSVKDK